MAKVLKNFRERLHGMKRYNVGDDYPEDDKKRVAYLVREGFLAEPEQVIDPSVLDPNALFSQARVKANKRKKGADADGSDAE